MRKPGAGSLLMLVTAILASACGNTESKVTLAAEESVDALPSQCASTAYIVEERLYGIDRDNPGEGLPAWAPALGQDFILRAQALPIDPSDAEIMSLMPGKPKLLDLSISRSFMWEGEEAGIQYHVSVNKFGGCLSEFSVTFIRPGDGTGGRIARFHQRNEVPSAATAVRLEDGSCQYRRTKAERFAHSVNGQQGREHAADIPEKARQVFLDMDAFNYGRARVLEEYGAPQQTEGTYSWHTEDGQGIRYQVEQKLIGSCSKLLSIRWRDAGGRDHLLTRESFYEHWLGQLGARIQSALDRL